jgi:peroxiredoxin
MSAIRLIAVSMLLLLAAHVEAAPKLGAPAPDFTLMDISGKAVKLSDFRGKHIVLEWTNPNCPYVGKHYNSGNMQALQQTYASKSVVWLTISSTNPSHPEYASETETAGWIAQKKAQPARVMLDKDGTVGRLYEARTTPHMFVIDTKGHLIFAGGIDDKRSWNPEDVKTAKNYVRAALDESLAGRPVSVASATPYG